MIPVSLKEVALAVGGTLMGESSGSKKIERVTIDSRTVRPGDLFIPIVGERFDGHMFLKEAVQQGAVCCFSQKKKEIPESGAFILVEDTRRALGDFAKYYRSLFSIPVVGITGSVGKTTTKDFIASVLAQEYCVLKTEGNYNNDIGLPLTIFQLEESHEAAVLEMGMNHLKEIERLADIARPDIAVITNIGVSHIENLGSKEGILQAKAEIFTYMTEGSLGILNADDDLLFSLLGKTPCRLHWYGMESKLGIFAEEMHSVGLLGTECRICTPQGSFLTLVPAPGRHMVENAMAAAGVGIALGVSLEKIKSGIEAFRPTGMRMAVVKIKQGNTILNDVYNANPVSMKAAIDVLEECSGTKAAILGDMLELGEFSEEMHRELGTYIAAKKIDTVIFIGEAAKTAAEQARIEGHTGIGSYVSQEEFLSKGLPLMPVRDTTLVKASRGLHLEKTVEKLREVD